MSETLKTPPAEMKLPHSPLPWSYCPDLRDAGGASVPLAGRFGEFTESELANAALIVASVNRHAELVEAHERLQWCVRQLLQMLPRRRDWLDPDIERELILSSKAAEKAEPVTDL